jgi:nitrate reductase NapD
MNLSAILVLVSPDQLDASIDSLNGLPGVEVHHTETATGRVIVVQEADSVSAEVDGLRRIQSQPYVRMAELVNHYFEEDPELQPGRTASPDETAEGPFGHRHIGDRNL